MDRFLFFTVFKVKFQLRPFCLFPIKSTYSELLFNNGLIGSKSQKFKNYSPKGFKQFHHRMYDTIHPSRYPIHITYLTHLGNIQEDYPFPAVVLFHNVYSFLFLQSLLDCTSICLLYWYSLYMHLLYLNEATDPTNKGVYEYKQ